ncbi:hypothetical protein Scep_016857 [Stephania cephalantha]|uniref:Uncharacterized protein n=1 Tax=Stephania cephalantha TaxID=152367 RepID=A0AAP0NUJ9_9MAGN
MLFTATAINEFPLLAFTIIIIYNSNYHHHDLTTQSIAIPTVPTVLFEKWERNMELRESSREKSSTAGEKHE